MTHAPTERPDQPAYSFRPSVLGAPRNFRLAANAIVWDAGRRSGQIAYGRITRVRLSFRPAAMQNHRFVTEIWSQGGPKLDIASSSWKSMVEQLRFDSEYRVFIVELHRRLIAAGTTARFDTGTNLPAFWGGLLLLAVAAVGLVGLVARAIEADAKTAALLIAIFLAVFLWYGGNYFRRNWPSRYRPDALPEALLPNSRN
jgi:hypothetical protein